MIPKPFFSANAHAGPHRSTPMRRPMGALILVLILPWLSACGTSEQAPAADPVLAHDSFTLESKLLGEQRLLNVYTPPGYANSDADYPVLYMPDGGIKEDFPHISQTIDSLIREQAIAPVLVVGIENTERRRDLTGETRVESDRDVAPAIGGSDDFRRFISQELIPEIQARYRINTQRAIVGESLAGYFVMETFLAHPNLFDRYIAMSPSLWWNDHALVQEAKNRLPQLAGMHRVLWFTTADETDIFPYTDQLAETLKTDAPGDLVWHYVPMKDQHHATIFRAAKEQAFRSALWKDRP
jgi:uncharacterized protein